MWCIFLKEFQQKCVNACCNNYPQFLILVLSGGFPYHFLVGSGVPDVAQCKVTGSPGAICERYLDRSIWREVFFFTSRCTLTRSQGDTLCGGSLSRGSKLTICNVRKASVSHLSRPTVEKVHCSGDWIDRQGFGQWGEGVCETGSLSCSS